MTKEEKRKRITKFGLWYQPIDFGDGIIAPPKGGKTYTQRWNQIRDVRECIDYKDKLVLDLGCAEGMWSFEAEKLGAKRVVATDIGSPQYVEQAFLAREILNSSVLFYLNVPVQDLFARMDCFFHWYTNGGKFDIVQHLGLFYHLRDPLLSLSQTRKCMKTGGILLFETAIYLTDLKEPVCLFNWKSRIYSDGTTWWAPNLICLLAMLRLSLFEPNEKSVRIIQHAERKSIGRVCLIAKAVSEETVPVQVSQVLKQAVNVGPDIISRRINQ